MRRLLCTTAASGSRVRAHRLADIGYRVGIRSVELVGWREKAARRETRMVNMLHFIQTNVFRSLYGRPADSLEKSREADDVCAFGRGALVLSILC